MALDLLHEISFILPKQRGLEAQENYVNHFPKKILMRVKLGIFGPKMINAFLILDLH